MRINIFLASLVLLSLNLYSEDNFYKINEILRNEYLILHKYSSSMNFEGSWTHNFLYRDLKFEPLHPFNDPHRKVETYLPPMKLNIPKALEALNGFESGIAVIGAQQAHRDGYKGEGERICIWDSGFSDGNPDSIEDLKGRIKIILNKTQKKFQNTGGVKLLKADDVNFKSIRISFPMLPKIIGVDVPYPGADLLSHGTHVAGIIGGDGENSKSSGIRKITGMAPRSMLVMHPIVSPTAPFSVSSFFHLYIPKSEDALREMLNVCKNEKAKIFSNSWGADTAGNYSLLDAYFDRWAYDNPDIMLVFAAGNKGGSDSRKKSFEKRWLRQIRPSIGSPASAKNVLSVGATNNHITADRAYSLGVKKDKTRYVGPISQPTNFSSLGPTTDMRVKPEISAPGAMILSLFANPWPKNRKFSRRDAWGIFNDNYMFAGGTSMSTPIVSGSLALVREYLRLNKNYKNPSSSFLKAYLVNTANRFQFKPAKDLSVEQVLGLNSIYTKGYGIISLRRALNLDGNQHHHFLKGKVYRGEKDTKYFKIPKNAKNIRITLAWNDPTDDPQKIKLRQLTNDLDLVVESGNKKYFPLTAISYEKFARMYFIFNGSRSFKVIKYLLGIFPITDEEFNTAEAFQRLREANENSEIYKHEIKDYTNNLEQIDIKSIDSNTLSVIIYGTDMKYSSQTYDLIVGYNL